jgi:hypothetical protein
MLDHPRKSFEELKIGANINLSKTTLEKEIK